MKVRNVLVEKKKFREELNKIGFAVNNDCGWVYASIVVMGEKFILNTGLTEDKKFNTDISFDADKGWQKKVCGKVNKRIGVRKRAYNSLLPKVKAAIKNSQPSKEVQEEYKLYLKLKKKYDAW